MAAVTFRVHYATRWGENLFLDRLLPADDRETPDHQFLEMQHDGRGFWSILLTGIEAGATIEYRYECRDAQGNRRSEPAYRRVLVVRSQPAAALPTGGCERGGGASLEASSSPEQQIVWDHFLAPEWPEGAFLRQAFAGIIFNPSRQPVASDLKPGDRLLRLTLRAPRVARGHRICISGGHELLGSWDPLKARVMSGARYPVWELDLPADAFERPVEFKFGLWDERARRLVEWESGANRVLHGMPPGPGPIVINYEAFQHATLWRGAGVAIPVFSLRTEQGYGIGEFADLALFAKWASNCKLHLVQLLPVNDTSSDFTWSDSYPYKTISTAALHPIYVNIERVFSASGVSLPEGYFENRAALNRLKHLDYERVLKDKLAYLREAYGRAGRAVLNSPGFKRYQRENKHWLQPYAGFCRLRDLHGTAEFSRWGEDAAYAPKRIAAWFKPGAPEYDEVMFHCWVQFHLDRQLAEALTAGHACGVAFKGDLPIGIGRASVEVWTDPGLFRMDRQTGAPPDAFAVLGQNWGFPTYNWPKMEEDHYDWWRKRFRRMSAAFDALRIDHILGFFRIWEIPSRYREGIMGHYNPALPLSLKEIAAAGFKRDPKRFTVGSVCSADFRQLFGAAAARIAGTMLFQDAEGFWRLRPELESAEARQAWYAGDLTPEESASVEAGLERLGFEVLFLEDTDQPGLFHPRINLDQTLLFGAMAAEEQTALRQLHDDFYHRRHTEFWANEAMKKLPALMEASSMLICGEDLGMVPDSVPIVLKRLGLLSLEVERWPKKLGLQFANPAEYPYLSVCTTSTHDMSTIRGWWEEEPETRQSYWSKVMARHGQAPAECSPEICSYIVEHNLAGASMWCVLPLQDWLGIDPRLRHPVASEERINVPAVARHYWRYRMHLTVESLLEAEDFNEAVRRKVEASGRHRGD